MINEDAFTNSDAKGQSLVDQVSTSSVVPLTTPFYGWIEYAYDLYNNFPAAYLV